MEQSSALAPRNTHGHRLLKYISCLMWTSTLRQAPAHTNTPPPLQPPRLKETLQPPPRPNTHFLPLHPPQLPLAMPRHT